MTDSLEAAPVEVIDKGESFLAELFPSLVPSLRAKFNEIDANSDGVLSREELRNMHEAAGEHLTEEMLIAEFERLDVNENGYVTFDEYLRNLVVTMMREDPALEVEFPVDRVKGLFQEADLAGDGMLNRPQIRQVLLNMAAQEGADVPEDQIDAEVESVFGMADRNGDGVVDMSEFVEWMQIMWFEGKIAEAKSASIDDPEPGETE